MLDLSDRQQLIAYLQHRKLWLNKSLGQHFLIDPIVLAKILEAAELIEDDTILEVGPGAGVLTHALASAVPKGLVLSVERDQKLVDALRDEMGSSKHVKIVHNDILQFSLKDLADQTNKKYKVVANVPYQISGVLLRKFLDLSDVVAPQRLVLMLQKEVIERLTAPTHTSARGTLTVLAELFGETQFVMNVPASSFFPAPKVESAVIRIDKKFRELPKGISPEMVLAVAKAGFSAKRRTLMNALAATYRIEKKTVEGWLKKVDLIPLSRAEELTITDWINLTQLIQVAVESASK